MIIGFGHGNQLRFVGETGALEAAEAAAAAAAADPTLVSVARAIPDAALPASGQEAAAEASQPSAETFGYLFPGADELPSGDRKAALEALAAAMADATPEPESLNADIAPIVTYMGQFIDHDVTAGTNTEAVTVALQINAATIEPQARSLVATGLLNMRKGSLGLDSLYGDGPVDGPMSRKLQAAMRDPQDRRRMRVGFVHQLNNPAIPRQRPLLPLRIASGDFAGETEADVPRVGVIVPSVEFPTSADLPEALRPTSATDAKWDRKAFIGDSRNDENVIVAQLHVAFLRLHNAFVERLGAGGTFEEARRLTTFHYQWLVVNDYLKAICNEQVLDDVIRAEAPIYQRFYAARKAHLPPGILPIPVEFATAAFRFGHSLVRGEYDYNRNFTRGEGNEVAGNFQLMFAFTGNNTTPVGFGGDPTLPDNWIVEWDRFTRVDLTRPLSSTRRIDTRLAQPLFNMQNEPADAGGMFQRLAERNLKRGHVQNLPTAQALLKALAQAGFDLGDPLTAAQVSGDTSSGIGKVVHDNGFDTETPLWFYILKEAELLGTSQRVGGSEGGHRLGVLGSRIVAETLVGLIVSDTESYWNAPGGPWNPAMSASGGTPPIDSMEAMFRAAGLL